MIVFSMAFERSVLGIITMTVINNQIKQLIPDAVLNNQKICDIF